MWCNFYDWKFSRTLRFGEIVLKLFKLILSSSFPWTSSYFKLFSVDWLRATESQISYNLWQKPGNIPGVVFSGAGRVALASIWPEDLVELYMSDSSFVVISKFRRNIDFLVWSCSFFFRTQKSYWSWNFYEEAYIMAVRVLAELMSKERFFGDEKIKSGTSEDNPNSLKRTVPMFT